MTLPSIAVRNALAFLDATGNYPRYTQINTRMASLPYVEYLDDIVRDDDGNLRFYGLNDAGREMAAKSTLAPLLAYLKAKGFRLDGKRCAKPGFLSFRNNETSGEAYISQGRRLYVKRESRWQFDLVDINA